MNIIFNFRCLGLVLFMIGFGFFQNIHVSEGKSKRARQELVCPFDGSRDVCSVGDNIDSINHFGVSFHTRARFSLLHYGSSDQVSAICPTGDNFYEQRFSDFIVKLLEEENNGRGTGARTTTGQCVGSFAGSVWYLDVGANVGIHALAVAAAGFPVVAIEAMPPTAARLACSQALNDFQHMHVVRAAAGAEHDKQVCMHFGVSGDWGSITASQDTQGCAPESVVATIRLDRLLDSKFWTGVSHDSDLTISPLVIGPTVMKMDVEGFEVKAISGYANLFGPGRPHHPKYVIIELIDGYLNRAGNSLGAALSMLESLKYNLVRQCASNYVFTTLSPVPPHLSTTLDGCEVWGSH